MKHLLTAVTFALVIGLTSLGMTPDALACGAAGSAKAEQVDKTKTTKQAKNDKVEDRESAKADCKDGLGEDCAQKEN